MAVGYLSCCIVLVTALQEGASVTELVIVTMTAVQTFIRYVQVYIIKIS